MILTPALDMRVTVHSTTLGSILFNWTARRHAEHAIALDDAAAFAAMDHDAQMLRASELQGMALSTVVTSSMAVEAAINELYLESRLALPGAGRLSADVARALHDAWASAERYEVVTKCHIAAAIAGKERMDFGSGAAQQFRYLIDLRNALVHHKPISVDLLTERHKSEDKLEKRLHASFKTAAIWSNTRVPFRWTGCLGGDCAAWAYRTAMDFQREFLAHLVS